MAETSEMVERVAEAIAGTAREPFYVDPDLYRALATAAIRAMCDPATGMAIVSRAKLDAAIEADIAPLLADMPAAWSDEQREYTAHLHRVAVHLKWTDPEQYAEIQEQQTRQRSALPSPPDPR